MRPKGLLPLRFAAVTALLLAGAAAGGGPDESIRARLDEALLGSRAARETSAYAVDLRTGAEIYSHGQGDALIPASNAKLWTTAAALEELGADYQFTTRLEGRGRIGNGEWVGDLKVIGGGDPSISGRFHDGRPTAVLEGWAEHLKARGISRVTGDLILDDSFFDREYRLESWPKDDPSKGYLAPMGGLSLNENCVELLIAPGGDGAKVTHTPRTAFISVANSCALTDDKSKHLIRLSRAAGSNRFTVSGKFWRKSGGYSASFAIRDPALYFGTVLREVLFRAEIEVEGKVRLWEAADREGRWHGLDLHRSPLTESVKLANTRSQNFHAEQIFKTLGREKGGEGTFKAASEVVEKFLEKLGAPTGSYRVKDGSGLSRENRLSALAAVKLISHMATGAAGEFYLSSLALSGDPEGTLRRRLRSEKTRGRVRAKTGSLRGVSCLSGVVTTAQGELVVFSILMNGTSSSGAARQAQDAFCRELLNYASD